MCRRSSLTEGQPPPVAANGGLSYMSFRPGTATPEPQRALEAALQQIAEGHSQALLERLDKAPPGPIETKWGPGFREYEECLDHIRASDFQVPEGGVALPLRYTVYEHPSYSIVPSNALWRDPARKAEADMLRKAEDELRGPQPLLPAGAARCAPDRRILSRPRCQQRGKHGQARRLAGAHRVPMHELLRFGRGGARVLPGDRESCCWSSSRMRPTRWSITTTCSTRTTGGDRTEDQEARNPGVNARYVNLVHNDLNDNSGRVRCRELLTKNLRNFGRTQQLHRGGGRREDVAAVHVHQPRQADGDGRPVPLRALRLAVLRRPALHQQLPHL